MSRRIPVFAKVDERKLRESLKKYKFHQKKQTLLFLSTPSLRERSTASRCLQIAVPKITRPRNQPRTDPDNRSKLLPRHTSKSILPKPTSFHIDSDPRIGNADRFVRLRNSPAAIRFLALSRFSRFVFSNLFSFVDVSVSTQTRHPTRIKQT